MYPPPDFPLLILSPLWASRTQPQGLESWLISGQPGANHFTSLMSLFLFVTMVIFLKVAFVDTMLSDSILTITLGSRNYDCLHLVDGETEDLGSLPAQSHQLVSDGVRTSNHGWLTSKITVDSHSVVRNHTERASATSVRSSLVKTSCKAILWYQSRYWYWWNPPNLDCLSFTCPYMCVSIYTHIYI